MHTALDTTYECYGEQVDTVADLGPRFECIEPI